MPKSLSAAGEVSLLYGTIADLQKNVQSIMRIRSENAKALSLYFDEIDGQLVKKRIKELKQGKTKKIPADEVWNALGI
ncbi:hypothetical protein GMMP15_1370077 [Candidatus Magnetomoraceae bacterium gMMP-15]